MGILLLFSQEKLRSIASYLNLVPPEERASDENWYRLDMDFLQELLVRHENRSPLWNICVGLFVVSRKMK